MNEEDRALASHGMDQLNWIHAIWKAEGGEAISLISLLRRWNGVSREVQFHLADFVRRHRFRHRKKPRTGMAGALERWATEDRPRVLAALTAFVADEEDLEALARALDTFRLVPVDRRTIPSYLLTEKDKRRKLAMEEFRAQVQHLGRSRDEALKIASDRHSVGEGKVANAIDGRDSKRHRK